MELHLLLLSVVVALGICGVAMSLIAWHFVRTTEAADTAIAERRLQGRSRTTRSARELRSSREAKHSRPLTTKQSRFDHAALNLSTSRAL